MPAHRQPPHTTTQRVSRLSGRPAPVGGRRCLAPPAAADASATTSTTDASFAAAEADANTWGQGPRVKRPENVAGTFWVDSKCIDCDTCRRIAPDVFAHVAGQSAVVKQAPPTDTATLAALLSCPTFSIHADPHPDKAGLAAAAATFPGPVPLLQAQADGGPPVLYCGLTSGKSFGASSYLLLRGGGRGNILVDSPRFDRGLAARILAHGPVDYMFLTHRDDVADHAQWAEALGCSRILHAKEANPGQGTDACEVLLRGQGPWTLPDGGDDVELVLQEGHTEASVVLLHKPSRALFTGDVLACASPPADGPLGPRAAADWYVPPPPPPPDGSPVLVAYRAYTWHSMPKLLDSLEAALVGRDFLHVIPGHGRAGSFASAAAREAALAELIARERAADAAGAPPRAEWL